MAKGLRLRDVVNDAAAVGSAVKSRRERLETLLSGRVPDLQHAPLPVNFQFLVRKIGSYRRPERVGKRALLEKVD